MKVAVVMRPQSLCCVLYPFLGVQKGLRAGDDILTSETSTCSSTELLKPYLQTPCIATAIETHVVTVAMAVDMAVDMAMDTAVDMAVDTALPVVLPAVDASHFSTDVIHLAART